MVLLGVTLQAALNTFILALITGLAAATVAAIVRLVRHLRRTDQTVQHLQHGQRHLLRWARRQGQQSGTSFPLEEDALDYFERRPEGEDKGPLL